jgi:DNA-binding winged helix-turn-helix (wHTH) protein/TolB-like protein/cytochrome c-type biogenesis protein CcmH/NrfG
MTTSHRRSYAFGQFRLDPVEGVLFHRGQPVRLTPKAFQTLVALVERHGHLVTKEELIQLVWPDAFVEENNLAQSISLLRRVLGDDADGRQLIETVPKRGYRFAGAVAEQVDSGDDPGAAVAGPAVLVAPPDLSIAPRAPHTARWTRRAAVWGLIAAVPVAFVVAGSWTRGRWLDTAGAARSTASDTERSRPEGITRIAILPFVNLGSPDDASVVLGMTDEIASRLARLSSLAVLSSTTVVEYERRGKDMRRIGTDLGVEYVLEGSVRWRHAGDGTRMRITPKLIRVADDTAVWADQYDASLSNLFAVQADIAYRIASALPVVLEARERGAVEAHPTADTEAYLAYLRGAVAYQQGFSDTHNQAQARADLEEAVASDPRFALAWSWLARVYAQQYASGAERRPETRQAAHQAARTAIALDADLPEAHLGLAHVLLVDGDYEAALRELEIASAGLPNSPELLRMIADVEQRTGRWAEARRAYMRAFDLDPEGTSDLIAVHYLHLRQYDDARRFIAVAKAANRVGAAVPEAWMHFSESGDVVAARRVLESALGVRSPADARVRGLLARFEWFDGRHQRALALIKSMDPNGAWLPANFRFPASVVAGQVYESMGRRDQAVRHYAAAMRELHDRLRHDPEDYQIHAALGMAAAGLGRAAEAVRHGERAVELQPVNKDAVQGPVYVYVLAQIQARLGDHASAFAVLDELFSIPGFYSEVWVQRDPAFATLRRHPDFPAYIARWSVQKGEVRLTPRVKQGSSDRTGHGTRVGPRTPMSHGVPNQPREVP